MKNSRMMVAIVPRGNANKVIEAARSVGAPGGTVVNARGTATSSILAALGLGDSKKEILYSMIPLSIEDDIKKRILDKVKTKGIMIFLQSEQEVDMASEWVMIHVICEMGFAEDVMAVARKAGVSGGTVINAHGTAKEDDVKFFGYPIVAEKEVVVIVEKREKAEAVAKAISDMEQLKKKGKAILFTMPVDSFVSLG